MVPFSQPQPNTLSEILTCIGSKLELQTTTITSNLADAIEECIQFRMDNLILSRLRLLEILRNPRLWALLHSYIGQ